MGTPLDYAPFEAPFGAHGEQGKQGKKFKIEGKRFGELNAETQKL